MILCAALAFASRSGAAQSARTDSQFVREHYVKREHRIPMRDGARLFTAVYAPKDASPARRYPIVIIRTPFSIAPYGVEKYPPTLGPDGVMLREGYIFVYQDVRGRYMSEGTFENVRPFVAESIKARDATKTDEASDAYDTIEWLLKNVPGNSGRVGMWGLSYAGFYAAMAIRSHHPALVAVSPQAPVTDVFFEDFHHNGSLTQAYFYSYPVFGIPRPAPTTEHWWLPEFLKIQEHGMPNDYEYQLALGPLVNTTTRFYATNVFWRQIVAHPNYDAFWQSRAVPPRLREMPRGATPAVLSVGGWFDAENLYGPLAAYRALRERDDRSDVALVMGPFGHRGWAARDQPHTVHGDLYFGDSLATRFQRDVEAPWFRSHLKGDGSAPQGALVFDTGRKRWQSFERWPAPTARPATYWLRADRTLSRTPPAESRASLAYVSDPRKPVPSRCGRPTIEGGTIDAYMSDDQRCFDARPDVLVFRTEVLRDDVTIAGPLTARLRVSTTGTDADFVVKLIDVYPDDEPDPVVRPNPAVHLRGYQQLVRGEIMRGRFRRSFAAPSPFVPGEITEVAVPLQDVFHTFRRGHRLMVQVQSSWFPAFDRNPQRYVPSIYEAHDSHFISATHRVHVGRDAASRIEMSVVR